MLRATSQSRQPLLEFRLGKPLTVNHDTGPFRHILDAFERVYFHQEKIRPPANCHHSELVFLVKEYRGDTGPHLSSSSDLRKPLIRLYSCTVRFYTV
jgi:hypothetical protein